MENRRQFIKNGLIFCLGTGAAVVATGRAHAFSSRDTGKWGMIIDAARCSGCQSCMVACKLQNHTVEGRFNTRITDQETGTFPNTALDFKADICRHCNPAPCVEACPTGAAFVHPTGIVLTDWQKCDGNGACIDACPYDARFHDPRFNNKTDKCDLCLDRINQGLVPACVENCPSNARIFGRFDKPEGEFADYLSAMSESRCTQSAVHVIKSGKGGSND
nr:4Fe-4S dicluster domain-containing protein [uncultured Desulfobacter sp.]